MDSIRIVFGAQKRVLEFHLFGNQAEQYEELFQRLAIIIENMQVTEMEKLENIFNLTESLMKHLYILRPPFPYRSKDESFYVPIVKKIAFECLEIAVITDINYRILTGADIRFLKRIEDILDGNLEIKLY